jgi:acyl-CoA dehydrogenase-like protein
MAEAAAEKALTVASAKGDDGVNAPAIGEMLTELTTAQMALESMVANANELDIEPLIEHANRALIRKTIVANAVRQTVDTALEATGGAGYFRRLGLERILRDAHAAQFHPMPARKQHRFTGRLAMGLDPAVEWAPKWLLGSRRSGEMSRGDPIGKLFTDVPRARKRYPSSAHGIAEPELAKANIGKRSEIREYFKIDPETRVKETHVHVGPVQDKPVTPFGRLPELKEHNYPVIRQTFSAHQFVQHPHEEVGVKVFVAEIAARPLVSPDPERFNDRGKFQAGLGEMILEPSRVRERLAFNNPNVVQGVEALAKQITGYARYASVDIGEAPGAGQHFPDGSAVSSARRKLPQPALRGKTGHTLSCRRD